MASRSQRDRNRHLVKKRQSKKKGKVGMMGELMKTFIKLHNKVDTQERTIKAQKAALAFTNHQLTHLQTEVQSLASSPTAAGTPRLPVDADLPVDLTADDDFVEAQHEPPNRALVLGKKKKKKREEGPKEQCSGCDSFACVRQWKKSADLPQTEAAAVDYLLGHKLVDWGRCPKHPDKKGSTCKDDPSSARCAARVSETKRCRTRVSRCEPWIPPRSRIKALQWLHLWWELCRQDSFSRSAYSETWGIGETTLTKMLRWTFRVVSDNMEDKETDDTPAPFKFASIDETKIGKAKKSKGVKCKPARPDGGYWAITLTEMAKVTQPDKSVKWVSQRVVLQMSRNRTKDDIENFVSRYTTPTSTICSDSFASYNNLYHISKTGKKTKFKRWQKVNHSLEWKAADGTHTNNAESSQSAIKRYLRKHHTHFGRGADAIMKVKFATIMVLTQQKRQVTQQVRFRRLATMLSLRHNERLLSQTLMEGDSWTKEPDVGPKLPTAKDKKRDREPKVAKKREDEREAALESLAKKKKKQEHDAPKLHSGLALEDCWIPPKRKKKEVMSDDELLALADIPVVPINIVFGKKKGGKKKGKPAVDAIENPQNQSSVTIADPSGFILTTDHLEPYHVTNLLHEKHVESYIDDVVIEVFLRRNKPPEWAWVNPSVQALLKQNDTMRYPLADLSQKDRKGEYKPLLVPIFHSSHWIMAIVLSTDLKVTVYDSIRDYCPGFRTQAVERFIKDLNRARGRSYTQQMRSGVEQQPANECAMEVINNAMMVWEKGFPRFTRETLQAAAWLYVVPEKRPAEVQRVVDEALADESAQRKRKRR